MVMASDSKKRELFKGTLRPPKRQSSSESYTQKPASQEEVSLVKRGKDDGVIAVEFDSRAIPQPFLDPSVIQQRLQAEKQWAVDQKKKYSHDGEAST